MTSEFCCGSGPLYLCWALACNLGVRRCARADLQRWWLWMWCAVLTLVSAALHVADHRTDTRDKSRRTKWRSLWQWVSGESKGSQAPMVQNWEVCWAMCWRQHGLGSWRGEGVQAFQREWVRGVWGWGGVGWVKSTLQTVILAMKLRAHRRK